jgi:prolipoprotein diacylglyceryltransferase
MLPILQIGPLALPTAALLLLAGFWLGLDLTEKQASKFGANPSAIYNMTLAAMVAGIIGARLAYAARAPEAFLQSPLSLLSLTPQMLDAAGGLASAVLAALVYMRLAKMAFWPTLDAAVSLLSVLAVALGLAHFASGQAFGAPADLPWSIDLWGMPRHPAQIYETLAALLVAAAVWQPAVWQPAAIWPVAVWQRADTGPVWRSTPGMRFWLFLALSAFARLILESFRGDSTLWLNTFRTAQAAAWLVLAISLWQIGRRLTARVSSSTQQAVENDPVR